MAQYVFQRKEKKYILNREQYKKLLKVIEQYMEIDEFGRHTICNLYFDTDDYRIIRRSIEKPIYKEKLRLRSYGIPTSDDKVYLELKKKFKGTVYKRRVCMKLSEAKQYLQTGEMPFEDKQVMKEIDYFIRFYGKPTPQIYIAYDRIAYYTKEDKSFRITFDSGIRSRKTDLLLESGDAGELLLENGIYVMEVKAVAVMPEWLIRSLEELEIYPRSFSKYGKIYTEKLT